MEIVHFIDQNYLKTFTPINNNIDINLIFPFIGTAQEIRIKPLLCDSLYFSLIDKIKNNTPLNTNEVSLMELIRPSLAYWTVYQAIPSLAIEIRGSGIVRRTNDQIVPATKNEIIMLRDQYESIARFHDQQILNFISKFFPECQNCENECLPKNSYKFGIYY